MRRLLGFFHKSPQERDAVQFELALHLLENGELNECYDLLTVASRGAKEEARRRQQAPALHFEHLALCAKIRCVPAQSKEEYGLPFCHDPFYAHMTALPELTVLF